MAVGGVQRVVLGSLARADRDRFDYAVLCTKKEGEWARDVRALGIPLYLQKTLPPWHPFQILRLARLIRRINPDLVHVHMAPLVIPVVTAARLAGVRRYLVHHHSTYERYWNDQPPLLHRWERWLTRRAGAVVAVSESVASNTKRRLDLTDKQLVVVPNGIAIDHFTNAVPRDPRPDWGLAPDTPLVVNVSRWLNTKRIEDFIEAGAVVARRWRGPGPAPVFVVIGTGSNDYRQLYEKRIEELGARRSVLLVGSRQDVPAILPTVQAGVLSSENEGFGLVVLEYLAAGVPLVATDLPSITELVRDGKEALLCPPRQPERLADNIERLLLDRELAARLTAQGRQGLERYSWEASVRGYEAIYDRLLAEGDQAKSEQFP